MEDRTTVGNSYFRIGAGFVGFIEFDIENYFC